MYVLFKIFIHKILADNNIDPLNFYYNLEKINENSFLFEQNLPSRIGIFFPAGMWFFFLKEFI